ncbi:MAG TPA: hypothetical protein VFZ75_12750 [Actinomycetota bacterium]|nr:hypothetical protein [Actinomycetota bacterium]
MKRSPERSPRAQALFALSSVAFLVAGLVWLDDVGPRPPDPVAGPGSAPSGAWLCPHGGGSGLTVALSLANPGEDPVTARVTHLGSGPPSAPEEVEVPAGGTVRSDVAPEDRGAATYVEFFGGWLAAGWMLTTEEGVAAEPCAADASREWLLADGTTQLAEEAYTIVTNPFSGPAVLDVVLYTADRPPVRHSDWTGVLLPARRSLALHLNDRLKGEPVVAVAIEATAGRVAAASLGVSDGTHVRSTLGWLGPSAGAILPTMQGSGQTELLVLSTADASIRFGVTALTEGQPRPAGGLTEQEHGPDAARVYAVPVDPGPTALDVFSDDAQLAAALRALGPGEDLGATAGAVSSANAWILLPASVGADASPGGVLVNGGEGEIVATIELLPPQGGPAAAPATVTVPPHGTAAVPSELWEASPDAALLVRAEGGPLVALTAATSPQAADAFALSLGVPLPHEP